MQAHEPRAFDPVLNTSAVTQLAFYVLEQGDPNNVEQKWLSKSRSGELEAKPLPAIMGVLQV